ncbi:MAG: hypothetical protein ACR2P7_04045 [bacterium]
MLLLAVAVVGASLLSPSWSQWSPFFAIDSARASHGYHGYHANHGHHSDDGEPDFTVQSQSACVRMIAARWSGGEKGVRWMNHCGGQVMVHYCLRDAPSANASACDPASKNFSAKLQLYVASQSQTVPTGDAHWIACRPGELAVKESSRRAVCERPRPKHATPGYMVKDKNSCIRPFKDTKNGVRGMRWMNACNSQVVLHYCFRDAQQGGEFSEYACGADDGVFSRKVTMARNHDAVAMIMQGDRYSGKIKTIFLPSQNINWVACAPGRKGVKSDPSFCEKRGAPRN